MNIYNIKTARMRDEDGNTEEDKPEILAIEKSPASTWVEQKKKKLKKDAFNPFDTDNFLRSARARKKRYISLSLAFYYHDHMLSKLSRIADISIV